MKAVTFVLLASVAFADGAYAQAGGWGRRNDYQMAPRHNPNDPRYRPHPSGGRPAEFDAKYAAQARSGKQWRITSDCASACTMGFGHFAKDKICIRSSTKLGFHQGNNPTSTSLMWGSYPADVKALINSHGGLKPEWLWIPASEFHRLGYKACK